MKLGVFTTIIALAAATGCVAQVGQPDEKTGTAQSSLGDGLNSNGGGDQGGGGGGGGGDQGGGGGGGDQNTNGTKTTSQPGDNPTSGDNQGPQPLPWDTTSASTPSGSQQKK